MEIIYLNDAGCLITSERCVINGEVFQTKDIVSVTPTVVETTIGKVFRFVHLFVCLASVVTCILSFIPATAGVAPLSLIISILMLASWVLSRDFHEMIVVNTKDEKSSSVYYGGRYQIGLVCESINKAIVESKNQRELLGTPYIF